MNLILRFGVPGFIAVAILAGAIETSVADENWCSPIPGSRVVTLETTAVHDIAGACLFGPTDRYKHFVLGSKLEAGGLRVRLKDGSIRQHLLPQEAVFEDRIPRIEDLDGDGRHEVVVVVSRRDTGSSLAVLGMRNDTLALIAETTSNGRPHRWLNPAGFGNFLGGGRRQVALVRMPHAVGRLEFWEFDGTRMRHRGSVDDVSNHRLGSIKLGLSAVLRRDPPRGDLLVIPSFDRRVLRVIDATRTTADIDRVPLAAAADGDFQVDRTHTLRVPLTNGSVASVALEKYLK